MNLPNIIRIVLLLMLSLGAMGVKCIPYNSECCEVPDAAPPMDGFVIARDSEVPDSTTPLEPSPNPCPTENQAELLVQNFAYEIRCGCQETEGLVCTVPVGTTVVWRFLDSEDHNVASAGGSFGESEDLLGGTFEYPFSQAGSYRYSCTLHPRQMSGYSIVVR